MFQKIILATVCLPRRLRSGLIRCTIFWPAMAPSRTRHLFATVENDARRRGVTLPFQVNTPYINTISPDEEPPYPGSREIERRLKSVIRWNALAMVVRANREDPTIGGHISTFASAATLYEVGFQHFFRGKNHPSGGDFVYFQGHASPGIYARAFLEGRLTEEQLRNFRREVFPPVPEASKQNEKQSNASVKGLAKSSEFAPELVKELGLSSYPHPWLMPDFWEFPTVSMGLGPLLALYQARFNHYLHDRGLKDTSEQRVWCFVGDGEVDEPETLGALTLGAREGLDNLIFVVNCNLQRSTDRCAAMARSFRNWRLRFAGPAGTSSKLSGATTGILFLLEIPPASWSSA